VVSLQLLGQSSLLVAWLFGVLGWPAVLVAAKPKFLGDEMAGGHLLLPGRSSTLRHVDEFDVLLGVANQNFVSSSGRASASSCFPGALLHFGVAEARRGAAPCAGDEDDREIRGWTKM